MQESAEFKPNTPNWSLQDNAYVTNNCGDVIDYQAVIAPGSASNNYKNFFEPEGITYGFFCSVGYVGNTAYYFDVGTNINKGYTLEEWYNINSHGYPTSQTYTIWPPLAQPQVYTFAQPSGSQTDAINAWELVSVCSNGGCSTTFSSGSGTFNYFQANIKVTGPNGYDYTTETSNCVYGSTTQNQNAAWQGDSC